MEVCGSVHIFLTPNQRSWMNAIKNAAAIKPKKKVERPQVTTEKSWNFCCLTQYLTSHLPCLCLCCKMWRKGGGEGNPRWSSIPSSDEYHWLLSTIMFLQNRYQAMVFDMVENRKFEIFIILVITVNMIVMMVQHYGQPPQVTRVLDILCQK